MKRIWILLCVLVLCLVTGCNHADDVQTETEPVWVITEQVTYDENKELFSRVVYQYEKDEYNYRVDSYNASGELIAYVVQEGDERKTVKSSYMETDRLVGQTISEFDADGRPLLKESKRMEGVTFRQVWNWSSDKTSATVISTDAEGNVLEEWTEEYDNENRMIREKTERSETTYMYEDKKSISRSDMGLGYVYYMVRYYDDRGRLIENRDYKDYDGGDYTEDDLVLYSIQSYKEDGHSLTNEYYIRDEATGEQRTGTVEITYQLLDEVLAK